MRDFAQDSFAAGEWLLDRVEVKAVRRVRRNHAAGSDGFFHPTHLVTADAVRKTNCDVIVCLQFDLGVNPNCGAYRLLFDGGTRREPIVRHAQCSGRSSCFFWQHQASSSCGHDLMQKSGTKLLLDAHS